MVIYQKLIFILRSIKFKIMGELHKKNSWSKILTRKSSKNKSEYEINFIGINDDTDIIKYDLELELINIIKCEGEIFIAVNLISNPNNNKIIFGFERYGIITYIEQLHNGICIRTISDGIFHMIYAKKAFIDKKAYKSLKSRGIEKIPSIEIKK